MLKLFTLGVFGRLVPQLIVFLADHLAIDHRKLLLRYQGLVKKHLGLSRDRDRDRDQNSVDPMHDENKMEDELREVAGQLEVLLPDIKDIALAKKSVTVAVDA